MEDNEHRYQLHKLEILPGKMDDKRKKMIRKNSFVFFKIRQEVVSKKAKKY